MSLKIKILKIIKYLLALIFYVSVIYTQSDSNYELKKIRFNGNLIFNEATLKKVIDSQESPSKFSQFLYTFTNFGGSATYYDPNLIESDLLKLKRFYADNGYFKAIINNKVNIDTTNLNVDVEFLINEREQSIINSFELIGLERVFPEYLTTLRANLSISKGINYTADIVRLNQNYIANFLTDRGYLFFASDRPIISIDTMKNIVDVSIKFNPGKRYIVNDVSVRRTGENKDEVDDQLLLDIVNIKPGSIYSRFDLQMAQVRLYRTNLFTSAQVVPNREDTLGTTVPISIIADVGKIYQLSPNIFINNEDATANIGFSTEFTKRNFLGSARKFTLGFAVASHNPFQMINNLAVNDTTLYGYIDSRVSLEQPFLFGKPINTRLEAYYTMQRRKADYNATLSGAKINFEFEMPRYTYITSLNSYFNWEYSVFIYKASFLKGRFLNLLSNLDVDLVEANRFVDSLFTNNLVKTKYSGNNSVLGFDIGMNRTNDPVLIFPTEGYNLSFLIEDGNTIPYLINKISGMEFNNPSYYKLQVTASRYSTFFGGERSAFATKLKVGYLHTYRGDKFKVPINQRFYSGGSNSVRAWDARELSPERNKLSVENFDFSNFSNSDFDAIVNKEIVPGGFILLEGSFETRLPIYGDLGTAIFVDYGNTWNDLREINMAQIAVGAGFGLRYYSPFAPIRIDIGFKVYNPNDRRSFFTRLKNDGLKGNYFIQLGIGEAF